MVGIGGEVAVECCVCQGEGRACWCLACACFFAVFFFKVCWSRERDCAMQSMSNTLAVPVNRDLVRPAADIVLILDASKGVVPLTAYEDSRTERFGQSATLQKTNVGTWHVLDQ